MITLKPVDYRVGLAELSAGSADLTVTDPPYGTTDCPWDKRVDARVLMQELLRVTKPNGAIVIFADQKLAVDLICAARKFFRYDLVWAKPAPVGFLNANRMPLRAHELLLVFYQRLPRYNPQFVPGELRRREIKSARASGVYRKTAKDYVRPASSLRHPTSVLTFGRDRNAYPHPTQKPLALVEWAVRSYSSPGDLVVEPFAGSGTTPEACINTGRSCIAFENDAGIFQTADRRIRDALTEVSQGKRRVCS